VGRVGRQDEGGLGLLWLESCSLEPEEVSFMTSFWLPACFFSSVELIIQNTC
jgi:hypothetical protein